MSRMMEVDPKYYPWLFKALEAATVKAALDGRMADKDGYENALAEVKAERIACLPSEPQSSAPKLHIIACSMSREELVDIQTAVAMQVEAKTGQHDWKHLVTSWRAILVRLTTTLTLNPAR